MKQLSVIQETANRQNRQNITDALTCASQFVIRIKPKIGIPNIFLIQNKGKGPPGRPHSPDKSCLLMPDLKPVAGKSSKKIFILFIINILFLFTTKFYYHEKANYYFGISDFRH